MRGTKSGNNIVPANVEISGGLTVPPTVYTTATLKVASKQVTTPAINIPAGALSVEIFNNSVINSITVNGVTLQPQARINDAAFENKVLYKLELLPAYVIVNSTNEELWIKLTYPSDSVTNPGSVI